VGVAPDALSVALTSHKEATMRIDRKVVLALVGGWTLYYVLGSQIEHLHPLIDSIVLAELVLRAIKAKD
jgi:hypothetical protein